MMGAAKRALKWSAHALDRLAPAPRGVTVLIYHRVGGRTPLDVDLSLGAFEDQMAMLADGGRVRSIDDALDALAGPAPAEPADDPVVVTFDDGTADFAELAHPVLERLGIPATIYVATRFVDRSVAFPNDGRPLTWSALRDTAATGLVTVGSHTHTHALLDRLPASELADELDRADALIAEHVGRPARHFAYPKAVAGSSPADAAVRARYRSAALAGTRPNPYGTTDPHRLARSPIQASDGMRYFAAKLAGGMHLEDTLRDTANRWRYRGQVG
jgi:peptidoglycan/xylan/chitin deacetylase (PgdA/CDA1 family)